MSSRRGEVSMLLALALAASPAWAQLSAPVCYAPTFTNPWMGPLAGVGCYPCGTNYPSMELQARAEPGSWASPLYGTTQGSTSFNLASAPFAHLGQYCLRLRYVVGPDAGPWGPRPDGVCDFTQDAGSDFCFTYDAVPPDPPSGVIAAGHSGSSRVDVSFNSASDDGGGILYYYLEYQLAQEWSAAYFPVGWSPKATVSQVLGAGTWRLRVHALDRGSNYSIASSPVSVTVGFDASVPVPPAPHWLDGTHATTTTIYNDLNWSGALPGVTAESWVVIEEYGDGGYQSSARPFVASPGAYLYVPECAWARGRIAAVVGEQVSDYSPPSPALFADATAPLAPAAPAAMAQGSGAVALSWSPTFDNCDAGLAYAAERELLDGGWLEVGQSGSFALSDSPPTSGSYRYRVVAIDTAGNRSASSGTPVSVTVPGTDGGPASSDAGQEVDAGQAIDAGATEDDAGTAPSDDGGQGPRLTSVGCGCQGAGGPALALLAALALHRRRQCQRKQRPAASSFR